MDIELLVINLERRIDRRSYISKHLTRLGLEFSFVTARDALLDDSIDGSKVGYVGDAGCWLSHQEAFKEVSSMARPALILEDDAQFDLSIDWPVVISEFAEQMNNLNLGVLQIGWNEMFYINRRWPRPLVDWRIERGRSTFGMEAGQRFYKVVRDEFFSGTHAYLVTPQAALDLLGCNIPVALAADAFMMSFAQGSARSKSWNFGRLRRSLVAQVSRQPNVPLDSDIA